MERGLEGVDYETVIALSSHAMRGDEEKARQAGCDDYLSKPLDENLLFEKLTQFLGES